LKKSINTVFTDAGSKEDAHSGYRFGIYTLDIDRAALSKDGVPVHLRRQSFDVLLFLLERAGRLVMKEELLTAVWRDTHVTDDSLTHCLIDIRKAIGDSQHELVQTVPRRGYIFDMPVTALNRKNSRSFFYMAIAACLLVAVMITLVISDRFVKHADTFAAHDLLDTDAGALYQQARFLFNRRASGDMETARSYYLQAIELDRDYADAWAGVAATYCIELYDDRADTSKLALIKEFAEKAIAIDPDNAEGHVRLAIYYRFIDDDAAANRHLQHALSKHPNDPLILTVTAGNYHRQGEVDLAIDASYAALKSDPLSLIYRQNLAMYLLAAGRYEEAIEQSARASTLGPQSAEKIQLVTGLALIKIGRLHEALDLAVGWSHSAEKYEVMAMANFGLGRESQARGAVMVLKSFPAADGYLRLAELQAYCDEIDLSFQTLTTMREQLIADALFDDMSYQIQSVEMSPFMANVRTDSRWDSWLAETREMMSEELVLSFR